jgi:hypothetical protein
MHSPTRFLPMFVLCAAWCSPAWSVPTTWDFLPSHRYEVVQVLAARTKPLTSSASIDDVASSARALIEQSRRLSDPRFLGRAQAMLAPWWNRAEAPANLAILQATIEQSRHHFDDARKTLQRILQANPRHAQALLTLATLEKLSGRYALAIHVCEQLQDSGATVYASACTLETKSLLGQSAQAKAGFKRLVDSESNRATRAWLLSLAAENMERAGKNSEARALYLVSLELQADPYTALALTDLYLRDRQWGAAYQSLRGQAESDAVLIRRAFALQQAGEHAQAQAIVLTLEERFRAMHARGEESRFHGREFALYALWIERNPAKALAISQSNLSLQKEPLDWWVYAASAQALGDSLEIDRVRQLFGASGLVDLRVSALLIGVRP